MSSNTTNIDTTHTNMSSNTTKNETTIDTPTLKKTKKFANTNAPPQEPQHLPCPRCNSTTTKFCYYNNYNFSQPRYFCKTCRRYWTQGGTLRNIPVGGGSRKNSKRSRASTPPSRDINNTGNFDYRHIFPAAAVNGGGGYTSYLNGGNGSGFFTPEVFGFERDGRIMWPFGGCGGYGGGGGGGGGDVSGGGGGMTWQLEGKDCFVLPERVSSTQGDEMK